jgi:hypothetical protein
MQIEQMERMTIDNTPINPFNQDFYHMGTLIGKNVTVMFEKFARDMHNYIIVINTITGERIRINLDK